MFNEPIWKLINIILSNWIQGEQLLMLFIFFTSFTYSFMVCKFSKNFILIPIGLFLLVIEPTVYVNQAHALRQGVASAILLWSLYHFGLNRATYVIVFLMGLVHVSYFLLFFILFSDYLIRLFVPKIGIEIRCLIQASLIILLITLLYNIDFISYYILSKHQIYVTDVAINVGGGLFALYFLILIYRYLLDKNIFRNNAYIPIISVLGLSVYLGTYFISSISGRWLNVVIIFIILDLVSRLRYHDLIFILTYIYINIYLSIRPYSFI